jgi:hypothetical protein
MFVVVLPKTLRRAIGCTLLLMLGACTTDIPGMPDFQPGVQGTVTSSVSGRPVTDATVTVQNKSTTTDTNGRYGIGNLEAGTWPVRVTHPAYHDAVRQVAVSGFLSPGDFVLEPK